MVMLLHELEANHEAERKQKILAHVERYKVTLVHVVKRLFFPSYRIPDHEEGYRLALAVLETLTTEGKLDRVSGKSECARNLFVWPGHRLKEDADLARLWFCCMRRELRYLALHEEVTPLFEAEQLKPPYHNYSHAVCDVDGGPVLMRLYLCLAEKKNARQQLGQHIGQKAKSFRHWIEVGSYGIAVLVQSAEKQQEMERLLKTRHGGQAPLCEQARFLVETVPTLQTFPQAIQQHIKETWK